mmetsp:Transcript_40898/g.47550  ORF Transcript_40898/g.47550 Transcript_40898/m.47550 type:complete len:149 (+) Transcript_40898:36-482(+)
MDMDMDSEMPMPMFFYTSTDVYFLFEGCESKSIGGLILGCFVTFLLAFLVPTLSYLKLILPRWQSASTNPMDQESLRSIREGRLSIKTRLYLTLITGVQYTLAGLVMLLFMTFNVWVFLAIVFGYVAAYFILVSPLELEVTNKARHCH